MTVFTSSTSLQCSGRDQTDYHTNTCTLTTVASSRTEGWVVLGKLLWEAEVTWAGSWGVVRDLVEVVVELRPEWSARPLGKDVSVRSTGIRCMQRPGAGVSMKESQADRGQEKRRWTCATRQGGLQRWAGQNIPVSPATWTVLILNQSN